MRTSRGLWAGGLATLLVLAGCSEPKTAEVSGTVTVDGEPVKRGSISFFPTDGNAPTAGAVIKDGLYSTKVPITAMKVKISAAEGHRQEETVRRARQQGGDVVEEGLPAKYNKDTELTFEVKPGKNQKDWELQSK